MLRFVSWLLYPLFISNKVLLRTNNDISIKPEFNIIVEKDSSYKDKYVYDFSGNLIYEYK